MEYEDGAVRVDCLVVCDVCEAQDVAGEDLEPQRLADAHDSLLQVVALSQGYVGLI